MNYVNEVLNMSFEDGFNLYKKCIKRIEEQNEKEVKDKYFQLFLISCENGYTGTFDEFYKNNKLENNTNGLNQEEKEEKRDEIIQKYTDKRYNNNNNYKRRKITW